MRIVVTIGDISAPADFVLSIHDHCDKASFEVQKQPMAKMFY